MSTERIAQAAIEAAKKALRAENMERLRVAREQSGHLSGNTRYGYMLDPGGDVIENPEEQAVLRRILELWTSGLSLRQVVIQLGREGIRSRKGNAFDERTLCDRLRDLNAPRRSQSETLRLQRARLEFTGGYARYGFAAGPDGRLVPVPREQNVIARARELASTAIGVNSIARALEREGLLNRNGRRFGHQQIAKILMSLGIDPRTIHAVPGGSRRRGNA